MWIEWEKGLINLNHVKRIYMEEEVQVVPHHMYLSHMSFLQPRWKLKIKLVEEDGEFVQVFHSKQEAYEKYEHIKERIEFSTKNL